MHVVQVSLLKELGYDYAFNYKKTSFDEAMAQAAPDGIDIYYEVRAAELLCHSLGCCGMAELSLGLLLCTAKYFQ